MENLENTDNLEMEPQTLESSEVLENLSEAALQENDNLELVDYISVDTESLAIDQSRQSFRYRVPNKRPRPNNAPKTTNHISRRSVAKVFKAYDYAECLERRINYYVVIHLKDTVELSASSAFAKIRKKQGDWLRKCCKKYEIVCPPTYVYSFENPNNNIHVNWCLHIPDELEEEFLYKLNKWVESVEGPLEYTTVYTDKIEYGVDSYKSTANYILKGIDPEFAELYFLKELQDEKGSQGEVFGKRSGFSRSIGTTAQRNAGFNARAYRARRMENNS